MRSPVTVPAMDTGESKRVLSPWLALEEFARLPLSSQRPRGEPPPGRVTRSLLRRGEARPLGAKCERVGLGDVAVGDMPRQPGASPFPLPSGYSQPPALCCAKVTSTEGGLRAPGSRPAPPRPLRFLFLFRRWRSPGLVLVLVLACRGLRRPEGTCGLPPGGQAPEVVALRLLQRPLGPPAPPPVSASAWALGVVLLASARPSLTQPLCKDEEYPVGPDCCPKCNPGFRVKEACGELTGTVCVPCLAGTYTAHLNGLSECLQCRVCDPAMGLRTRRECSSTENTVCGCPQRHVCVREDGDHCALCRPHTTCPPGQRVRENGTEWQDTLCEDCPAGTFAPHGALHECQPWTQCRGLLEWEAAPGTSSSDATCASSKNYLWALLLVLVSAAPIAWLYLKKRRAPGRLPRLRLSGCYRSAHCLGQKDTCPQTTDQADGPELGFRGWAAEGRPFPLHPAQDATAVDADAEASGLLQDPLVVTTVAVEETAP
ncbi:LOW QUALITY PROTEIN: tumor necrosis factor receptor superfamily member 14-like [Dasypus novemcinctus]|uniref:LOW QUALITY PROTEIN: tumor necrosis factor receptor superfamily member 14-like n=1 Tax=Dasypus novemcinctus TaxID=9361 RepID=UPI00266003A5|nr:LOW QUALITY PROTEIN: tumor necrosis factor receptor superfamily member 14-like [Dasypus novemcinctus]